MSNPRIPSRGSRERTALTRLFVYTRLMAGEKEHDLIVGARRIAEQWTRPEFDLWDWGGDAQLAAGGTTAVLGEVYEVDEPMLAAVDNRFSHLLERVELELDDGTVAQTHIVPRDLSSSHRPRIESGSWRAHEASFEMLALGFEDRGLVGTRREIVDELRKIAGRTDLTLREYIEHTTRTARGSQGALINVTGDTDEQLADSFLKAALRADFLRRL